MTLLPTPLLSVNAIANQKWNPPKQHANSHPPFSTFFPNDFPLQNDKRNGNANNIGTIYTTYDDKTHISTYCPNNICQNQPPTITTIVQPTHGGTTIHLPPSSSRGTHPSSHIHTQVPETASTENTSISSPTYKHTHTNAASTLRSKPVSTNTHHNVSNTPKTYKTQDNTNSELFLTKVHTSSTHQARTIQPASQTFSHLTQILNQHKYTQFKYTHENAKVAKRNNRQHVGIARRETTPHLQIQYITSTTIKRTKAKIQTNKTGKIQNPPFSAQPDNFRVHKNHPIGFPFSSKPEHPENVSRYNFKSLKKLDVTPCDTTHLLHNLDKISGVKRLLTRVQLTV
jgi:hypothetical protein